MKQKIKISEAISKVADSPSSVFTKDDVINLLNEIKSDGITKTEISNALESVLENFDFAPFIVSESLELNIKHNQVDIQHVEVSSDFKTAIISDVSSEIDFLMDIRYGNGDANSISEDEPKIGGCGADCACRAKKKKKNKKQTA